MTASTEKKTRNIPQLSKDVRTLNVLRNRRAKFAELDAEIEAIEEKIAATLGFGEYVATDDGDGA